MRESQELQLKELQLPRVPDEPRLFHEAGVGVVPAFAVMGAFPEFMLRSNYMQKIVQVY
jgi:hypothetical protein